MVIVEVVMGRVSYSPWDDGANWHSVGSSRIAEIGQGFRAACEQSQYLADMYSTKWCTYPDSKVYGANMGPTWGQQDPGGPHVDPMDLAIWVVLQY